jgi:pyridoxine 5'-phosphate synthase PdxJ
MITKITSVSIFIDDETKQIKLNFPGGVQNIVDVEPGLYENFKSEFVREKGKFSKLQQQKYQVLMDLMKAAYVSGKNSN